MKDKKIIAMFVTSAVALVVSVVITLGVALTLADPVPALAVTRTVFNFGASNASEISQNGNSLEFENAIVFTPVGSLVVNDWDMNSDSCDSPVSFIKGQTYEDTIMYMDESLPSRVKLVAFRVNNTLDTQIQVSMCAKFDKTTDLGLYTKVVFYAYSDYSYLTSELPEFIIGANDYADFCMIVYADDSKYTEEELAWGEMTEEIGIVVSRTH